ncbi:MAG: hypothetical protein LUC99_12445 [Clostridiales bacterium]|nr:hypothetical protein [Clostridiales bacterium]
MPGRWRKGSAKELLAPAASIAVCLLLYGILTWTARDQGAVTADGQIARGGYGSGQQEYEVVVEGLRDEDVEMTVTVEARRYTQEEAEAVFAELMDSMEERIRGANPSLWEVREDLVLPSRISEKGVRLRWTSSDPEMLGADGTVHYEGDEPGEVRLSVQISDNYNVLRQTYEMPVRLLPPVRSEEETLLKEFGDELRKAEEDQREEDLFTLPQSFAGRVLTYRNANQGGYESILLLGILSAVLLWLRERNADQQRRKQREQELLLDYADLLSKLVVLTGAGLTIRNAWERMVHDYETERERGQRAARAAYEEMKKTLYQLQNGMPETEAYREFGQRCKLQPYRKLSTLLEQNRRTGTKNLREVFQTEMTDAFEQRKNLARRLGKEAGTRLLLPLFLMLGIVMVMMMVPAMMAMG